MLDPNKLSDYEREFIQNFKEKVPESTAIDIIQNISSYLNDQAYWDDSKDWEIQFEKKKKGLNEEVIISICQKEPYLKGDDLIEINLMFAYGYDADGLVYYSLDGAIPKRTYEVLKDIIIDDKSFQQYKENLSTQTDNPASKAYLIFGQMLNIKENIRLSIIDEYSKMKYNENLGACYISPKLKHYKENGLEWKEVYEEVLDEY